VAVDVDQAPCLWADLPEQHRQHALVERCQIVLTLAADEPEDPGLALSAASVSWSPRNLNVAAERASRKSSWVGISFNARAAVASANAEDPAINVRSRSKKAALGPENVAPAREFSAAMYCATPTRVPTANPRFMSRPPPRPAQGAT